MTPLSVNYAALIGVLASPPVNAELGEALLDAVAERYEIVPTCAYRLGRFAFPTGLDLVVTRIGIWLALCAGTRLALAV